MSDDFSLSKRALLVKLSVPSAQSRRKDVGQSEESASRAGADAGLVSTVVSVIPPEYAKPITSAGRRVSEENKLLTLAWDDDGGRILPVDVQVAHAAEMQRFIPEFNREVEKFAENLPAIKQAAKNRLGTMFREENYESPDAFRARMKIRLNYYPIPQKDDFRVDLDADSISWLRSSLEDDVNERLKSAMDGLKARMAVSVEEFITRLSKFEERMNADGDMEIVHNVRSSLITNVSDLVKLVPGLNITKDDEITNLNREMARVCCTYSIQKLRASPDARKIALRDAQDLLNKMKS